jgi:gamma-glutamyltranspeptidase/glutathione hydrolase
MTPTIIERDGKPVLVLGSPGGPRIITAVLQTLTNIVDFGVGPAEAVAAARVSPAVAARCAVLRARRVSGGDAGGARRARPPGQRAGAVGAVALIAIGPDRRLLGVNDPRRPAGAAMGY